MKSEDHRPDAGKPAQSLSQLEQRLKQWRQTRVRGAHIPKELWTAAAQMTKHHSLHHVCDVLRLDLAALQRHTQRLQLKSKGEPQDNTTPRFMEMVISPARVSPRGQCSVQLQNARGATMNIELHGEGLATLAGLCNAFMSAP
jgi:hypothetical protein